MTQGETEELARPRSSSMLMVLPDPPVDDGFNENEESICGKKPPSETLNFESNFDLGAPLSSASAVPAANPMGSARTAKKNALGQLRLAPN